MGLSNYKRWKDHATNFASVSHIEHWNAETQHQIFEELISDDARDKVDLAACLSFNACVEAISAYWKNEWNKETLLTRFYHGQIDGGNHSRTS